MRGACSVSLFPVVERRHDTAHLFHFISCTHVQQVKHNDIVHCIVFSYRDGGRDVSLFTGNLSTVFYVFNWRSVVEMPIY